MTSAPSSCLPGPCRMQPVLGNVVVARHASVARLGEQARAVTGATLAVPGTLRVLGQAAHACIAGYRGTASPAGVVATLALKHARIARVATRLAASGPQAAVQPVEASRLTARPTIRTTGAANATRSTTALVLRAAHDAVRAAFIAAIDTLPTTAIEIGIRATAVWDPIPATARVGNACPATAPIPFGTGIRHSIETTALDADTDPTTAFLPTVAGIGHVVRTAPVIGNARPATAFLPVWTAGAVAALACALRTWLSVRGIGVDTLVGLAIFRLAWLIGTVAGIAALPGHTAAPTA